MNKLKISLFILITCLVTACKTNLTSVNQPSGQTTNQAVNIEATVQQVVMQTQVAATVEAVRENASVIEYLDNSQLGNNAPLNHYHYSQAQNDVITNFGEPTEYFILFTASDREESWYYPQQGKMLTFLNGTLFAENEIEVSSINSISVYPPSFFTRDMPLETFLSISGAEEGLLIETDDLIDSGQLIYLKGISAGFIEDQLRFVQSIPIQE